MFEFCKQNCDHLTVHLHDDPSTERPKMKPVHTVEERIEILKSIKYVDAVTVYSTENELALLLANGKYDVRFLGDDYREKNYTGKELNIPIVFVPRQHTYSTTALKKAISESYSSFIGS
jgi:glycerol-3-phosphate cytidylyltransferase